MRLIRTPDTDAVSRLVPLLYDASLDMTGASWTPALEAISALAGARAAAVLTIQRDRYDYGQAVMVGAVPEDAAVYQAHYARLDPCLEPQIAANPAGTINVTDHLIENRDLVRTEFYADWVAPRGWHSGIGVALLKEQGARALMQLCRERGAGPFPAEGLTRLRQAVPHLQHAVHVASRMAALAARPNLPLAAVGQMRDAVFVTDARSQIVYANESADVLLAQASTVQALRARGTMRSTLAAVRQVDSAALQALIAAACAPQTGDRKSATDHSGGGTVVLRPQGSGAPLLALVTPLRTELPATHALFTALVAIHREPQAMVIIVDPGEDAAEGRSDAMVRDYLRGAFGLTEAEVDVALALADGGGLSVVAEARGVSLATVRTQAQRIYDKTGLRSQATLAGFVTRVAAGIARARGVA